MSSLAMMPMAPGAGEIAATAAAAQSMAAVQARYALAVARPRDIDAVRVALLADCKRPGFAEVARYSKPVGGTAVEGPSIRFVEAALRAYRNVYREVTVLYDTDSQRCVRVSVTDLEANITHSTEIVVGKTVERKRLRQGQQAMSERVNSYGQVVYRVEATDDDVAIKQAAMVSKAIRELGLRILPGDLVDEGQAACIQTKMAGVREDPERARKALVDAFVAIGVQPTDIARYLGHPIAQMSPREVVELRQIYASVRDGETTWSDILETKTGEIDEDEKQESKKATGSRVARATERVRASAPKLAEGESAGELQSEQGDKGPAE